MFFSKITLKHGMEIFEIFKDKKSSEGYVMHQILWKLFPNDGTKKRDFIFSKDEHAETPRYFMVSAEQPVQIPGVLVQSKIYDPRLSSGQGLAFSLNVNPVVARKSKSKKRSDKHDVWMDAKREGKDKGLQGEALDIACRLAVKKWLIRQGVVSGFNVTEDMINVTGYHQHCFYKNSSSDIVRFSSVQFDGKLTVAEPEKFRTILFSGLGRAKGFGCGMMLVRRLSV